MDNGLYADPGSASSSATAEPTWLIRFMKWFGGAIFLTLAGLGVTNAYQRAGRAFSPPPPPLTKQYATILHEAARERLRVVATATTDFKGTGALSRIFILRPTQPSRSRGRPPPFCWYFQAPPECAQKWSDSSAHRASSTPTAARSSRCALQTRSAHSSRTPITESDN
jgi:hypothetical protein